MKKLKNNFYDASEPECSIESKLYKPAITFEVHTGISGIAGDYLFPNQMSASEYEIYSNYTAQIGAHYDFSGSLIRKKSDPPPVLMAQMQKDWAALTRLNPSLKKILVDINDPMGMHDALHGVACLLNTDDINLMLQMRRETKSLLTPLHVSTLPGVEALKNEIFDRTGEVVGWVACPKTLRKIKRNLPRRKNPIPQA